MNPIKRRLKDIEAELKEAHEAAYDAMNNAESEGNSIFLQNTLRRLDELRDELAEMDNQLHHQGPTSWDKVLRPKV